MITYFQGTRHTQSHPDTAVDMLRELAAMLRSRKESKDRNKALADRVDGLAEVTPGDINGWALITYLRLAGAQPPNGTGLEEFANRLQCLAELHVLAMLSTRYTMRDSVLGPDNVPLDVDGALRIAGAWVDHAARRNATAHEHAMLATFLRERAALQACARVAR